MATKAERFRAEVQRSLQKPKPKPHKPEPVGGQTRVSQHAAVKLETSATKPSRKSTRSSANRSKPDSNLQRRESRARRSPESRAEVASARDTKVRSKRPSSTAKLGKK